MTVVTHNHKHIVHIAQHGSATETERLKKRIELARKRHEKKFEIFDETFVLFNGEYMPWWKTAKVAQ